MTQGLSPLPGSNSGISHYGSLMQRMGMEHRPRNIEYDPMEALARPPVQGVQLTEAEKTIAGRLPAGYDKRGRTILLRTKLG